MGDGPAGVEPSVSRVPSFPPWMDGRKEQASALAGGVHKAGACTTGGAACTVAGAGCTVFGAGLAWLCTVGGAECTVFGAGSVWSCTMGGAGCTVFGAPYLMWADRITLRSVATCIVPDSCSAATARRREFRCIATVRSFSCCSESGPSSRAIRIFASLEMYVRLNLTSYERLVPSVFRAMSQTD